MKADFADNSGVILSTASANIRTYLGDKGSSILPTKKAFVFDFFFENVFHEI